MFNWRQGIRQSLASSLLIVLCCATLAQKKPSSLQKPGAGVHIVHRHELVAHCRADARGTGCVEQRVKAPAGAELVCSPIADPLISTRAEDRSPVALSLPNGLGTSALDIQLAAGAWEFSWSGQRAAVRVLDGRQFQVRLSTISGRCVRRENACQVDNEITRRALDVPPEYGVTN